MTLAAFRNHRIPAALWWILSALWIPQVVQGQGNFYEYGICACTPNSYDFFLDFSLKCPTMEELELVLEDGIETAECAVVPSLPGDNVTDFVPASAQFLEIVELRQDNTVAVQESIQGNFLDGDVFRYLSFSDALEDIQDANDIPKTLQFTILGQNRNGKNITNVVIIEFNNNCDAYPVIQSNHTAGWIRFMDSSSPNTELCSAYSPEVLSNQTPSEPVSIKPPVRPMEGDRQRPVITPDYSLVDFSSAKNDALSASPTQLHIKYIGFGTGPPSADPPSAAPTIAGEDSASSPSVDDEVMPVPCSICGSKFLCIQSPEEVYPDIMNQNRDITCREVEIFAVFSTATTYRVCNALQANAAKGLCGGCGTTKCVMTTSGYSIAHSSTSEVDTVSSLPSDAPSLVPTTAPFTLSPTSVTSSIPTALSQIQTATFSNIPSDAPSLVPTAGTSSSLPSDSPSLTPTNSSTSQSKRPSMQPSTRFPSVSPSFSEISEDLDQLYGIPPEFNEESDEFIRCKLCPEGCLNSPNELFPYLENGVDVSCRAVEEFALVTGVKASSCSLLKTYAFWGACGGCGIDNCP